MSESKHSSTGEKVTVVQERPKSSGNAAAGVVTPAEPDIPPISFLQLFRFSTKFEIMVDIIGLVAAAAAGAAQPLMSLLFGRLTQSFVEFQIVVEQADSGNSTARAILPDIAANFRHAAALNASYLVYIGVGMLACTYLYMYIWVYTGEVNAKRIREKYLQAILRQDITFFDKVGPGEVTTRIQTDTHCRLDSAEYLGEGGSGYSVLSTFITGFVLAYIRSWRLALAMSSILPCMILAGGIMNKFVSTYMHMSLGFVPMVVVWRKKSYPLLERRRLLAHRASSAVFNGIGLSVFIFVIYSAYALAFSFAILIGSFSLAMLAPEMQAVTNACGAAAKLYSTIDRIPDIDSADPGGLKPEKVEGRITLEGIEFSYPSRPNVQVVKGVDYPSKLVKLLLLWAHLVPEINRYLAC
ncbi:ABC transporter type 1, transmembrane domain-containing protein [Cyathus striatus]|nr:ABC transporter type 1, transmembrane domain-containing protein [Cyathus striatus]